MRIQVWRGGSVPSAGAILRRREIMRRFVLCCSALALGFLLFSVAFAQSNGDDSNKSKDANGSSAPAAKANAAAQPAHPAPAKAAPAKAAAKPSPKPKASASGEVVVPRAEWFFGYSYVR